MFKTFPSRRDQHSGRPSRRPSGRPSGRPAAGPVTRGPGQSSRRVGNVQNISEPVRPAVAGPVAGLVQGPVVGPRQAKTGEGGNARTKFRAKATSTAGCPVAGPVTGPRQAQSGQGQGQGWQARPPVSARGGILRTFVGKCPEMDSGRQWASDEVLEFRRRRGVLDFQTVLGQARARSKPGPSHLRNEDMTYL